MPPSIRARPARPPACPPRAPSLSPAASPTASPATSPAERGGRASRPGASGHFTEKLVVIALIATSLPFAIGCGAEDETPEPEAAELVDRRVHPATGEGFGHGSPAARLDRTKVRTDLMMLRAAIRTLHATDGAYPSAETLNQMEIHYRVGEEYRYDPADGSIESTTLPGI